MWQYALFVEVELPVAPASHEHIPVLFFKSLKGERGVKD